MSFQAPSELLHEHRAWLEPFHPQHLRNWGKLLKSDQEAAACEAAVRRVLVENGNAVEPNETLNGSDPSTDFLCTQKSKTFSVEVTSISIAKATEITNLPECYTQRTGSISYGQLNGAMWQACNRKTRQCSHLQHPAIVAVGTFHGNASCVCFEKAHLQMLLTGQELIASQLDTVTGDASGEIYLSTKLHSATFLRPDPDIGMSHARNPVSGMFLCGFGCDPPTVRGILHPSPIHKFDPHLLPFVEFCRLRRGYESGQLATEWTKTIERST